MKTSRLSKAGIVLVFTLAALLSGSGFAAAEAVKKVAVLPFTMYAEKDLTFLQKGIQDMLASRLFWEGRVSVLGRQAVADAMAGSAPPATVDEAAAIGRKLDADHVLFGSLTVFGQSVSVDAKMVDVTGARQPLSFFTQSETLGGVIPAMDGFAAQVNEKVFGRQVAQSSSPAPAAPVAGQAAGSAQQSRDIYQHPEKLVEGGVSGAEERAEEKAFIETGKDVKQFWKSRNYSHQIHGLDIGDVDGDGKMETVVATVDTVLIYRMEHGKFYEASRIEKSGVQNIVGIDVGDINKNGVEEIFVSALNRQKNVISSYVFEKSGQGYSSILEKSSWYYRIVPMPDRGKVLFGQGQKASASPFLEPIFEMAWDGNGYATQNRMLPGGKAAVMGFAYGDPTNSKKESSVVFNQKDYIEVLEPSGEPLWTSPEPYGGSSLYVSTQLQDPGSVERRSFFPMRLRLLDLDGDGTNEILVAGNQEMAGRRLDQFRNFTSSRIHFLGWDGLGLAEIWKTRQINGYIRDFCVGDFDNDGIRELVAAIIIKDGDIVGTDPKTAIIAYELKK